MKRQSIRMLLLLLTFSAFLITISYLAPAPPSVSLEIGNYTTLKKETPYDQ